MHRQRPDLIVPIRDRRRRRRVLTLRNAGYAALTLVVAFIAITIRSEMRRGPAEGDYGRLYHRELPSTPSQRPLPVVKEATIPSVDDHVSADPLLMQPAARSQWLDATNEPVLSPPPITLTARDGNARVTIVGGREGVIAVNDAPPREKKLLKGGIFRNE